MEGAEPRRAELAPHGNAGGRWWTGGVWFLPQAAVASPARCG
jgi:hypothetical protein